MATRLTRLATDLARFDTPDAARLTVLRLGRESFLPLDLRAEEARFVLRPLDFRPLDFRPLDLRAARLRPPPLRAVLLRPVLLRAAVLRRELLRAGPFLPLDLRAGDFRLPERPAFLPPFEPPRDDFLAAMIRAPIWGFFCATIATSAHKL